MNPRLLTAPTFPQLERRLLEDLAAACAEQPFAPRWVIVPNATLASHLRARLAGGAGKGGIAGVRVANLPRFAGRLAGELLGKDAARWGAIHDLTLEELVARLPKRSPLGGLREIAGGAGLLHDTFADLAHGGFGVEDLDKVRELAGDAALGEREKAVLGLFAEFVEILAEREIPWGPMTLQLLPGAIGAAGAEQVMAALGAQDGQEPRVFVHGFYEWLDVNLGWLAALAEKVPLRIYYPWLKGERRAHPAYAFTDEILEELAHRMSFLETEEVEEAPGACGKFFLKTFPEGVIAKPPAFLTWQQAAGVRAEAISAAVRIRSWMDDPEDRIDPEDILVVAPDAEGYGDTLRGVFHAFGIPLQVSDLPAGRTPSDDARRTLARIWEEKAPAERVFSLLRAGPLPPMAEGVEVDALERKIRGLGVWGGETWRAAAEARGESAPTPAERRLLEGILFFGGGKRAPSDEVPLREARGVFERMARDWLADSAPIEELLEAVRRADGGGKGLRLELREWAALLAGGTSGRTLRDPPSRSVRFAPVMRARGLTAKGVVLLGLAAGQMPRRVEDNPLLSDAASLRIARAARDIGHRLPMKSRVPEEMLLLFQLVNTAAERVHWVVPETDAAGRAVAPTPWVQRYLRRWGGCGEGPFRERIPPSTKLQTEWLADLDRERGSWLPPGFALYLDPGLAASVHEGPAEGRLAASIERRGREPEWSGAIGTPFSGEKLRVTRIERLAECPFRFWCEEIEELEALRALVPAHALDPRARGTLVHGLLEAAVRPHLGKKKLSEIAAEMLDHDGARLGALAREVAEREDEVKSALGLIPRVFREAEIRAVVELASRYFRWAREKAAIPREVEVPVTKPWPGWPGLRLSGKIDQVEEATGGETVVDFKSGKYPPMKAYLNAVKLGWGIQAALYPWLRGEKNPEFRYLFLGHEEAEEGEPKGAPTPEDLLDGITPFLRVGFYPPTSTQTVAALGGVPEKEVPGCRFCELGSVCRRFEAGHVARHAELLAKHAPRRAEAFRRLAGGPAGEGKA